MLWFDGQWLCHIWFFLKWNWASCSHICCSTFRVFGPWCIVFGRISLCHSLSVLPRDVCCSSGLHPIKELQMDHCITFKYNNFMQHSIIHENMDHMCESHYNHHPSRRCTIPKHGSRAPSMHVELEYGPRFERLWPCREPLLIIM